MKTFVMAIGALLAGATAMPGGETGNELGAKTVHRAVENSDVQKTDKNNQIVSSDFTYSGIAVGAVKAENKLQLLNPRAPDEYGTAEDGVVRDPITRAVTGLKIFSIEF